MWQIGDVLNGYYASEYYKSHWFVNAIVEARFILFIWNWKIIAVCVHFWLLWTRTRLWSWRTRGHVLLLLLLLWLVRQAVTCSPHLQRARNRAANIFKKLWSNFATWIRHPRLPCPNASRALPLSSMLMTNIISLGNGIRVTKDKSNRLPATKIIWRHYKLRFFKPLLTKFNQPLSISSSLKQHPTTTPTIR